MFTDQQNCIIQHKAQEEILQKFKEQSFAVNISELHSLKEIKVSVKK